MPPASTGVADYSAALFTALRELGSVELGASKAGAQLYHLGNNQLHREIYERALREPGFVVLHDAVLHHFFLGSLAEPQYVEEFVYNYGLWHSDLARRMWAERARSATDPRYFNYPMLKRIASTSRAVIVHNPAAAAIVKEHAPGAVVQEIPHLFLPPELPRTCEIERLRLSLGLKRTTFLFGVFGHLRESKRLIPVLRAFDTVRRSTGAALLVAGEFASTDLKRAAAPLLSAPGILRAGYLDERDFWLYASAVDACINLRHPAAGETSGIAIRFMGIGKPVLLSDGREVSRVPECACIRIDHGPGEEDMLRAAMLWLASSPSDARTIGEQAAQHIHRHHAIGDVAKKYWQIITRGAD